MKLMLRYLRPFFRRMSLGLLIKTTGTVIELMLPLILSHILKDVVLAESVGQILLWGALMVVCAAIALTCNIVANRMAAKVAKGFTRNLRHDLFEKTISLSPAQTDEFTVASLESRVTTDTYHVHNFVNMIQRLGVRAPILLVGGIGITLFMDAFLALVMIAVLPFIFCTVFFISSRGVPMYTEVQKRVDSMVRVVREDLQGIRVIKALNKTQHESARYDTVNRELSRKESTVGAVMGIVNPVMTLLMNGGIVAVIALSANRVANGLSHPETVIAFMQYFTLISMAMMSVTRMFTMYTKCAASSNRIRSVLEAPRDLLPRQDLPLRKEDAHIVFENVCFSYKGKQNDLEDISFSLKRGESLGIIGATGSGKSTLIRLLLRHYDVGEGSVRINGKDVRSYEEKELYSFFGSAMQQDFLFADTVEENLLFGRELSREDLEWALKIAQADGFVHDFPDGFSHKLSQKAANLSGGQKQRLLIARAVAARPEILILDDSSSALDYKTDAMLRKALAQELKGSTVVTVAQRVSSVKDCDLILVLDEGRIIGRGSHEELMAECEEYRHISESQMGGAFVE